jgi:hypothetical protein
VRFRLSNRRPTMAALGLTFDVRDVLKKHGYDMSDFDGMDFLNLQQALFRFLYSEHDS